MMIALKILGWLFLGFVLFQALFNPWTPIFYIWRRWVSEIQTWIKDKIETPFSEEGGTIKITLKDYSWEGFVEATLYEFKKKYKWSKKPTWVFRTGGASHPSNKSDSISNWVHEWIKNHPKATVENTCKTYVLPTLLEIAEENKAEYIGLLEKAKKNSKDMLQLAAAYKKIIDGEKEFSEENIKRLQERIENINKAEQKRQESINRFSEEVKKLDNKINTLKAA